MTSILQSALNKAIRPFSDLTKAPRAIWYVIGAFVIDSTAYFGILTLMTTYLGHDLGWGDAYAAATVSLFTMLVTLAMLGIGSVAESFGLRRAILVGLAVAAVGRAIYCLAPDASGAAPTACMVIFGLLLVAGSSGILQPVCYSGVKQFTDEKTSSMGYAVIYAFMNLGIVVIGALSAWVRPGVQAIIDVQQTGDPPGGFLGLLARFSHSGVQAVNWLCCAMTVLALLLMCVLLTRRAESTRLRPEMADEGANRQAIPWRERLRGYFTDGPFGNARFVFFIFMLLPVRTLFAHQWLTMPQYILRSYPTNVGDKMEWLVNWINPGIIFIGVPLLTAMTRRANVYTMMVVGSLVSAVPTFLLCMRAEPERADRLLRGFLDWRGALVGALSRICQRTGPARTSRAVHGACADPVAVGQGDDRTLFRHPVGEILSGRHAARPTAHRHPVVHLRVHCDDHADWPLACPKVGHQRAAPTRRQVRSLGQVRRTSMRFSAEDS